MHLKNTSTFAGTITYVKGKCTISIGAALRRPEEGGTARQSRHVQRLGEADYIDADGAGEGPAVGVEGAGYGRRARVVGETKDGEIAGIAIDRE